jgi:hypothetical protein
MSVATHVQVAVAAACLLTGRPAALLAAAALLGLLVLRHLARTHAALAGSAPAGVGALPAAQWRQLLDRPGDLGGHPAGGGRRPSGGLPAPARLVQPVAGAVQHRQR